MSAAENPTVTSPAGSAAVALEDDGIEIELEPSVLGAASAWSVAGGSIFMDLTTGSMPSIDSETSELLRHRLKAAALFLAVGYGIFFVFGLLDPQSVQGMAIVGLGLRTILCGAVAGFLAWGRPLSLSQLRGLEYGFFGILVLLMMIGQYVLASTLIDRGDFPRLVALEKNGVINLLILMVLYGVFIPNDPRTTARVVLTMALGPFLVLAALQLRMAGRATMIDELASHEFAIANSIFFLLSAGLATYASYILNGLRLDLRRVRQLGQYHLGEKLGQGGMGEVYLAEHQLLKRPCALKLIRPEANANPTALARFEREVQAAALLTHPNTIEVFDYGRASDGTFYYVMEYLPGLNVAELVQKFGPMPPGRVVYLLRQVCGALAEAHQYGLIHRDLKPANIHVAILGGKCDVAKVLDFGLVKPTADPDAPRLTAEYSVSGTPQYMSPEQTMAAESIDGRADLYSLGAVGYYMLTGRPPFEGSHPTELMIAHARDQVVPPSRHNPEIPADLEAVILRCLEKDPNARFPDARALAAALAACACASDWDEAKAEAWWIQQAKSQIPTPVSSP
jgi:hypothetical protein